MKRFRALLVLGLVVGLLALVGVALALPPAAARPAAQQATPTPTPAASASLCDELQVIFIVDQSGSMAGYTDAQGLYYPPTDPLGMRFEGLRVGFETILGVHPSFPDVSFKAAVIDFGDAPSVRLPWTDLNPLTPGEADAQLQQLAPVFNPTGPLGNTLPGDAIEQAASLFAQQDQIRPQVDGCPRRVAILLTDGLPFDDVNGFNWQTHLADAAAYTRQFLPFPDNRLYVIGLDQNGAFFDDALDEWVNVTGSADQVKLASSTGQMGSYVAQILTDALANTGDVNLTRGCAENGEISVPPYKQQLRILLFKTTDLNLHLEVEDPNGRRLDNTQSDITITGQTSAVETLIADNPQPGVWRVLTQLPAGTEDQCLVNFIAIPAVAHVLEPAAGTHVPRFGKVPIAFQLVNEAGQALPSYGEDQYDLQMNVKLRYATGAEQIVSLSANPGQEYSGEATVYYEGPAAVRVNATALDPRNQLFTIFDTDIASFEVDPVTFVSRDLPVAGQRIGQHTPVPISFAVLDSNNQPVELAVTVDVDLSLTADGQPQTVPALTQNGGVFSTTLPLDAFGPQTLVYTATVSIPAQGAQPGEVVTLGSGRVAFDVYQVSLITAQIEEPAGGIATDPLLRATGLPLVVRLVDEAGQPVTPAAAGAGNPTQVFDVTITDDEGVVRLQGNDQFVTTGEPGVFQLKKNDLGRGNYSVVVRPATTLAENYNWAADEWSTSAVGQFNPWFLGVVAAALSAVGLLALVAAGQARLRRHPLSGAVQVYEQRWTPIPGEEGNMEQSERTLLTVALPSNKNRHSVSPSRAGDITRLVITSPDEQTSLSKSAIVEVYRKKMKKAAPISLSPNHPVNISGTQYYIVKDRRPGAEGGVGSTTAVLSDEF